MVEDVSGRSEVYEGVDLKRVHGIIEPPSFFYADWFCTLDRLTIISAPPGVGKTYFCLAMALAMSRGAPFLGEPYNFARPLKVAYIDVEMGGMVMLHRLKSLVRGLDLGDRFPDGNLKLYCLGDGLPEQFDFASPEGQYWVSGMIDEVEPDVVIADPLINLLGKRVSEKDNKEMNEFFISSVKSHTGVNWFVCHHENKGGEFDAAGKRRNVSQRIRGATSIEGNADRVFSIIPRSSTARLVEFGKSRHWIRPGEFNFEFIHNPMKHDDPQWIQLGMYVPKKKGKGK